MMTLVIGGASSGKSEVAENLCMTLPGKRAYTATMMPSGEQAHRRIERHLALRNGKGMETIEQYTDLSNIADKAASYNVLLIECMTNLVANEQFRTDRQPKTDIACKIYEDILLLRTVCPHLIVVTGDVFCDGFTYPEETMSYIRHLGSLNCMLATSADRVIEVFYGLATDLKTGKVISS